MTGKRTPIHFAGLIGLLFSLASGLSAQTTYFWRSEATNGNWNDANNWWNGSSTSLLLGNEIIRFNNNVQTTMTNNAANVSRYRIWFDNTATTARTIGGSSTNNFFDFGGVVPQIVNNSTANHAINFPINASFGNGLEINASSGPLTIGGVISGPAANELLFWGVNNVTLNAANTYTGETQINNGTLTLGSSGTLASSSNIFLGIGSVVFDAALTINNNSSYGNNLTVNPSSGSGTRTITIGGSNTPSITGSFTVNRAVEINSGASANLTLSGVVSGVNNLTKSGAGNLSLSGATANTYSGDITVSAGTLTLNKSADIKAVDDVTVSSSGTLSTSTANQWGTGAPALLTNNGTVNFNNNAQKVALTGSTGSISLGTATVTISNTGSDTYSGSITGTGGLTKEGAGTQTLSGPGTLSYTGTTTITAGILNLASTLSSTTVVVNGTLTLQPGATLNVSSITVNGTLNIQSGAVLNVTAGGAMAVNGSLNMNGGTLALLPLAVPTATITYGGSSELFYNAGGTVSPTSEWPVIVDANTVRVGSGTTLSLDKNGLSTRTLIINGIPSAGTLSMGIYNLEIVTGGTFTNFGSFNAGTGTVIFTGSATIGGTVARTFYDVETSGGLVNFGTGPGSTISNSLEILSGGGVVTNKPTYSSGSTLIYNIGGNYFSNLEWETTSPAARPHHISVIGGTDLVLDNPFVFECNGNLSISGTGSSVIVDATAGDVGVFGNFTLGADASMTLSSELGDDLFVRGNWTNNGSFDSNERAVFFDQGNTQTVSGTTTMDFLVVSKSGGSATLLSGATLNIDNGLTTTTNFIVASGGNLTLVSDVDATAWLDNFSAAGNVTGTLTAERYIAGPSGFRFISSPLSGATINGDLSEVSPSGSGFVIPTPACSPTQVDASSPYGNVMQLVESANTLAGCTQDNWQVISTGAMTAGRGYSVSINSLATIDVTGTAPTGTITYPSLGNSGGDGNGYHLVGNPFPSPMEWNGVAGFDGAMYIFEASGSYLGTFNDRLVSENYVVPSSQAFQVRVPSGTPTFSVGNADRLTSASGTFHRTDSWYDQLLTLDVEGNGFMDKTRVYFTEGASSDLELADYDAFKKESNYLQPTLFTAIDGEMIGTNGLAPLAEGARAIPMGLKPGQNGTFTISVNTVEGFPATARILLEDLTTGHVQDLVQNPTYTFSMTTGEVAERFLLHFVPGAATNAIAADCEGSNGQLEVDLGTYTVGATVIGWDSYRLENADGGVVASGVPTSSLLSFSSLTAGDYQLALASGSYEGLEAVRIEQPLVATAGFEAAGSAFYAGEPIQLLDRSEGSAEYRYDFGNGIILTGEASPAYTYAEAGSYLVSQEVWSADGCLDQSTQSIDVMSRVSSGLNVPANNMIVWTQGLQAYVSVSDLQPGTQLVLTDVLGRSVAQRSCTLSPCQVTAPAAGAYILMLQSENSLSTRQIILQD